MITPQEADARIRAALPTVPSIDCPLDKCAARILREAIVADRPFPPFNRSMMDGYALRSADLQHGTEFHIQHLVPAGSPHQLLGAQAKSCVEIMTGAVVPEDCDCVIPYEQTRTVTEQSMQVLDASRHQTGDCIHRLGSDHFSGSTLLQSGCQLGSREIAIAATCGKQSLQVSRLPAITIISTGDELVPIDQTPQPHQIRRSNDLAIETALACAHFPAKQRRHLPDDRAACTTQLSSAIAESDILIITGGISMGKKDYIPQVLNELGLQNHFHGITQKPGKPMGFWSNQDTAVFALPGNPLSTLVSLHRYVIPALLHASGAQASAPAQLILTAPQKTRDDITTYLPVIVGPDGPAAAPAQNSGDFVSILQTQGFIELPPAQERSHPTGTSVHYYPWL
ncbi:molybdenum cofactor synthesis domain protein [Coraliomargarita akajimensis DSM 45221]|uniref:Molybdopterin molybdenumtransferase n=1 Tax=Coraliomargarita akajimensis (strain DSM 45221 / IAM 15411 / JCM 23193 / KCTC 12865 / 04OKA010-24) TaxID=583355 RepID=D5EMF5_CORAD|nr:molybdenum cofactor synthesis domain protein [Coraliomargarita akajimensis DSM 45221]